MREPSGRPGPASSAAGRPRRRARATRRTTSGGRRPRSPSARFTGVAGTVVVDDDPTRSSVEVEIDVASLQSGDQARDDHLRSEDLVHVAVHPSARFRSRAVDWVGSRGTVTGELTIKGVTRPVSLEVDHLGHAADPWGNDRAVFSAHTTIDRGDFGLTWNIVLEAGGLLVSDEIRIEIEIETVRQQA